MAIVVKSGVKKDHRGKKNGASREEYLRLNREENAAREPQEVIKEEHQPGTVLPKITRRRAS